MAKDLLRNALDFDDVDLDANRNGAMAPKQRLMLSRKQGWEISHTPGTYFFCFRSCSSPPVPSGTLSAKHCYFSSWSTPRLQSSSAVCPSRC